MSTKNFLIFSLSLSYAISKRFANILFDFLQFL